MTLIGKADLRLCSEILSVNLSTLRKHSEKDDFPAPSTIIGGVRLYDVSRVARYLGVPIG